MHTILPLTRNEKKSFENSRIRMVILIRITTKV